LRQCSWVPFTRFKGTLREITRACVVNSILLPLAAWGGAADEGPTLELTPRVCSLAASDKDCRTQVTVSWHSVRAESLCLVVAGKRNRCWEGVTEGSLAVDLAVTDDVTFELQDPELRHVVASAVLRVIRETTRYRHRRREPWNVFE
jgi:Protein of unknown function (DUF3019)